MRGFVVIALAALLLPSCRTQKEVQTDVAAARDSVAVAETRRTSAVIDSALAHLYLAFDTLTVTVERPAAAETVRLKAVGASFAASSVRHRAAIEVAARTDSAEVTATYTDKSEEHASAVSAYNPPSMTLIVCVAAAVALLLLFLKKKFEI